MRSFNRIGLLSILFLWSIATACSQDSRPDLQPDRNTPGMDTISLIRDKDFLDGLTVQGNEVAHILKDVKISPYGPSGKRPTWLLSEWASKFVTEQQDMKKVGNSKEFMNAGKSILFSGEEGNRRVRMDVTTSKEYQHPRKSTEPWVHLLIEQVFTVKPTLKEIQELVLTFRGRLTDEKLKMSAEEFNPGLHTAQFQLYLTIQDLNEKSPGFGDFLWFGIPFYDYRYDTIDQSDAPDIGTGKYIYSIGTKPFTQKSFKSGEWISLKLDLKPYILQGLKVAKERGFLLRSSDTDFRVTGFNLGWEVPGTIDAGFEFENFDIKYIPAK